MTMPRLAALARRRTAAAVFALAVGSSAAVAQTPAPVVVTEAPAPVVEEAPAPAPSPFDGPFCERPKLFGNWGGIRDCMFQNGVSWDVYSTNFYNNLTAGGLEQADRNGGRADVLLNINGEKAGLWKGLFIDLHVESIYGRSTNPLTGAIVPISLGQTLPAPETDITALTGVKVTQALSENLAVFFGKINTVDGFNQPFTGGARGVDGFMNAGILLPAVLVRTVPYSTYGAGLAVLREGEPVFTLAVFDTNNTPTESGFDTFFNNGATVNAQVNVPTKFFGLPGHQSVGGTYSSADYFSLNGLPYFLGQRLRGEVAPPPQVKGSWSAYYMFDQALWADAENPKRSIGLFGNAGVSDGDANPIRWNATVGLGGASPLRGRPRDTFGVGYYYIGVSDALKDLAPRLLRLGDEQGVEIFYNIAVTPWCHITPDLQFVNPLRERVDRATNFGLRAKIDF